MLPYGNVWRESRRIFAKYFNSPHHTSINKSRNILYVRRFLGQLLQKPDGFLQHARTYVPFTVAVVNRPLNLFLFISLVGSTTLAMTYGINVRPYNDPYIAVAEEAAEASSELFLGGTFLVDVIPILKYVPHWFPGAKFQRTAAVMRTQSGNMRNVPFAEAQHLMVFIPWLFLLIVFQLFDGTCSGKWQL